MLYVFVFVVPLAVQVRMESSSKWPEDLTALRDAKTAFLLHMAKQYDNTQHTTRFDYNSQAHCSSSSLISLCLTLWLMMVMCWCLCLCRLQRDSEVKAVASREWVDVSLQGFVFRASLAVPKELRLLEAMVHNSPNKGQTHIPQDNNSGGS
jgi:hypothetical protein